MSYTQSAATATCKFNAPSLKDLITDLFDYCTNHEDELPDTLADYDEDDFTAEVSYYLDLIGDDLTIHYDGEDDHAYSAEVFDFLSAHYARLMTSKFMKVTWMVYDSRDGLSAGTDYYDKNNNLIDIDSILNNA